MDEFSEDERIPTIEELKDELEDLVSNSKNEEVQHEDLEPKFKKVCEYIEKVGYEHPNIKPRELKKLVCELDNQLLYIGAHKSRGMNVNEKAHERKSEILKDLEELIKNLKVKIED